MRGKSRKTLGDLFRDNKLASILMASLLMLALIYVLGESLSEGQRAPILQAAPTDFAPSIPVEAGVFRRAAGAMDYLQMPTGASRNLRQFYQLRAYPGAPPIIPHDVENVQAYGGKACLRCHKNGGFVPKFNAYAPVAPHPEMLNCRQCHVAVQTASTFRTSAWKALVKPEIHNTALNGSPPVIPHALQMRENCLACHAGPAAVAEVQVSHPDRINCRQCHAIVNADNQWQR